MKSIISFIRDEAGQDIVEYSLIVVLVAAAAVATLTMMGQSVAGVFSKLTQKLNNVADSVS